MKSLRAATAVMAFSGGLVGWGFVADPAVAGAVVSVRPQAEYTEDPLRSTPAEWVSDCPAYRFCTTQVGSGGQNIGFQFYRCTVYSLTNWGVNGNNYRLVYNHQNVSVHYLNSRHAVIDTTPPGQSDVVNFKPVWFIDLCA